MQRQPKELDDVLPGCFHRVRSSAVRIVVFHIESNSFCCSQTDNLSPFLATIVVQNGDNLLPFFGNSSHRKWQLTIVAILVTIAAENGDYRRQKRRQFVAFLPTVVAVSHYNRQKRRCGQDLSI